MWVEALNRPGEGDEDLSDESDNDPPVGGDREKSKIRHVRKSKETLKAGDVGRALRSVYDNTLREDVPRDFLDLLGKLS